MTSDNGAPIHGPIGRGGLRGQVVRGGAIIVFRQGLGSLLSIASILFVTRRIGPHAYGLFATGFGLTSFVSLFATWGLDVYLLRGKDLVGKNDLDQAFTALALAGVGLATTIALFRAPIANGLRMAELTPMLPALAAFVPLSLLAIPAVVQLDRTLRFADIARIELTSQIVGVCLAIFLAWRGFGAWAPAAGALTQAFLLLTLAHGAARYVPAFRLDRVILVDMVRFGFSYSGSLWLFQMRALINPIVVGRIAGAEAVGVVALAVRMAEVLSFARSATWRVGLAALSRISESTVKVRMAVEEGMRFQAISVGLPLALGALFAPIVVPHFFGARWAPALPILSLIGLGYLANATLALQSSALYLYRRNSLVGSFHAAHLGVFACSAYFLVTRMGTIGYAWAEIVAIVPYAVLVFHFWTAIGRVNYLPAAIWFLVFSAALLVSVAPPGISTFIGVALLLVPLALPGQRASLVDSWRLLRRG